MLSQSFQKKLEGKKKQESRWKRALKLIDFLIGEAIGELYVKEQFPPEVKKKVEELVSDVKSIFLDRLNKITWISDITRKRAIKKFSRLSVKIGYPDKFRDYSSFKTDEKDLFGNFVKAVRFEINRQIKIVGKKVDKGEWLMPPHTVNAYYNSSKNELVFPAGIL